MRSFNRTRVAMAVSLGAIAILLAWSPPPEAAPPHAMGWVRDPSAVEAVRRTLAVPQFASTVAYQSDYGGPDDVFLWDACRSVTGSLLPPRNQGSVGACVGFGTAAAIEHLVCVQIADGEAEAYRTLAPEIIYAGSRVEIGGGQIRGDGNIGAWAAQFVREYGVLPRGKYPELNLQRYDAKLCRKLGRSGVPDDLEPQAKEHPLRTIANVTSFRECQAAIRNGYPLIVCSDQGFTMARDAEGFCTPKGNWNHCMAIVGIRGGPRPGAFLLNSWGGTAHSGPRGLGDPSPAGFWADAAVVDRMLQQGDSWAFSQFTGFPARSFRSVQCSVFSVQGENREPGAYINQAR